MVSKLLLVPSLLVLVVLVVVLVQPQVQKELVYQVRAMTAVSHTEQTRVVLAVEVLVVLVLYRLVVRVRRVVLV